MDLAGNHSPADFNRRHHSFSRNPTNGTPSSKATPELHANLELESRQKKSDDSIFVTAASKTLAVDAQQTSSTHDSRSASNSGNVATTSFRRTTEEQIDLHSCPVCCDQIQPNDLKEMPCCSTRLCSSCLITHTITNIRSGRAKIDCPACSAEMNSSTILYNAEIPVSIRERYQEILAEDLAEKHNTYIKLCPHCNFITILDENDPAVTRKKFSRRSATEWIRCEQCTKDWCWDCYAPAHPDETCRQYKKNRSQLDRWAKIRRSDNQQRNAQRCPKCSIYIEKVDGCDHMLCTKCNSKFCYRCGSRMRLPLYIGHDSKYSLFGCRDKLWPDRPVLRWLVRGSVFTGIIVLTPVALAAALAVVAVGIPTVLVIGSFALPIFACIQCKKR